MTYPRFVMLCIITVLLFLSFLLWITGCGWRKTSISLTVKPKEYSGSVSVTIEPQAPPPRATLPPRNDDIDLTGASLGDIQFGFDSSFIRQDEKPVLSHHAMILVENPAMQLRIEGHCDERGSNEYNMALGERRAMAVKEYLQKYGIAAKRLSVRSYGEEQPIDKRHNEEAWAVNRRVEFQVEWGE